MYKTQKLYTSPKSYNLNTEINVGLQIAVIKGKFELFTSFIQTIYLNQYVISVMPQLIK